MKKPLTHLLMELDNEVTPKDLFYIDCFKHSL